MPEPTKPVPQPREPAYDWHAVDQYISQKYGRLLDDWGRKFSEGKMDEDAEYQCFWHWMLDRYNIHNGCEFTLYCGDLEGELPWVQEILTIIGKEFPEANGELRCTVSW